MFLTGPKVVGEVLGERVSRKELGGPGVHGANGVAQVVPTTSPTPATAVRALPLLPAPERRRRAAPLRARRGRRARPGRGRARRRRGASTTCAASPPRSPTRARCSSSAPAGRRNLVVALARLDGRPVGIVANQPRHLAGVLDSKAAEKGAWFIRLCDRFGIPLLVLDDTPGFMPGTREESRGVIRLGAKLVRAFARRLGPADHGRAAQGLRRRVHHDELARLGADLVLAWPSARGRDHGRQPGRRDHATAARSPRRPTRTRPGRSSRPPTPKSTPAPRSPPPAAWWTKSSTPPRRAGA